MFEKLIKRANVVIEALPYLREFHNKIIVIKYGGAAMADPELKKQVMRDIVLLKFVGMHPVIVHGGGQRINRALKRKRIEPKFISGIRVTNAETIKVVVNILGKRINSEIVSLVKKWGGKSKGFYGKKGKIIKAKKLFVRNIKGHYQDVGFVGQVIGIRYRYLWRWIKKGYIPVLAPIGIGRGGKPYNINADQAAAAVAAHLKAAKLMLLTNVRGVLDKDSELVSEIDSYRTKRMIDNEQISGGMIPKVKSGLHAIKKGVEKVHIIDGRIPHAILLEIFTDRGIGTMVVK